MKKLHAIGLALLSAPSMSAMAQQRVLTDSEYIVKAKVISVTPQYSQVTTNERKCVTETVTEVPNTNAAATEGANIGGAIIGGLLGGLAGNQVGGGSGRTAATIVGAAGGAYVGGKVIGQADSTPATPKRVERCTETPVTTQQISGYIVNYETQGLRGSYIAQSRPATNFVDMRISIAPAQSN